MKTHAALLGGMDSYRTTQKAATAPNGNFDILSATIVRVPRTLPNSEKTRDVLYRVKLPAGEVVEVFPEDQRQSFLEGTSGSTGTLQVKSDSPATGAASSESAGAETLAPNPLVNSDDTGVVRHMKRAVGTRQDPWEKAVAIQEWVFTNLKKKNFSNAFASASEVARNLEGDCSEHSVLTAAMCRAAGVPCRIVVGLVYAAPLGGFGPHAWNEVFVNGRWVAIDSAFNQSVVDATHLKLATSSLDGVAPFEAFLPVVRVLNKLTIEPVEVR
jgi:transglutaminase-like putative cysteine protease